MLAGNGSFGSRGRAFTDRQASEIREVLQRVRRDTGLRFSVCVATSDGDSREYARRLHGAFGPEAPWTVLVFVDPDASRVEIVTGAVARRHLGDRICGLAVMSMSASFSVGDLAGGIVNGIGTLADHARPASIRPRPDAE